MASQHCPFCDGNKTTAILPVQYSGSILIEHKCINCGGLFFIMDRRTEVYHEERHVAYDPSLETNERPPQKRKANH